MIKKKTMSLFLVLALVLTAVIAIPATTYATDNFYFKSPQNDTNFKVGDKVEVSFYAGVERKQTSGIVYVDPLTGEVYRNYEEMPAMLFVYNKDGDIVYSEKFKYYKATTLNTSFIPNAAGKYELRITGKLYSNSDDLYTADEITINVKGLPKKANTLKIKAKTATVKYKKLKKKNQTFAVGKVISFTKKGQGKMTYAKASGNKKITINKKTGKVTVKKKLKKGTYKVKVKVKAAGNSKYKPVTKTVTFKIKVK